MLRVSQMKHELLLTQLSSYLLVRLVLWLLTVTSAPDCTWSSASGMNFWIMSPISHCTPPDHDTHITWLLFTSFTFMLCCGFCALCLSTFCCVNAQGLVFISAHALGISCKVFCFILLKSFEIIPTPFCNHDSYHEWGST